MKLDIRKQRGAISLFALLSMLFFLIFLLGVFATISNRNRTQTQTLTEIKEIYNKDAELIYWLKIAPKDAIVPIYTKEQLKLIDNGTDTYVEINERIYNISGKSIDDCEVKVPIYIYESDDDKLKSYVGKDGMVILSTTTNNGPKAKQDGLWDDTKGVNSPKMASGMKAVYWDEYDKEYVEGDKDFNWDKWYDYKDITVSGSKSNWANAKTEDGSYWVWIPRFAYKITSGYNSTSPAGGTIDIKFVKDGNTGITSDGMSMITSYSVTGNNTKTDYFLHPAFGSNKVQGGWNSNLYGFWVAKFDMSLEESTDNVFWSAVRTESVTAGDVATSTSGNPARRVVSMPSSYIWRYISIGNMYSNSYNYDRSKESHLMKNTEWGAVVYLAHSKYGRNGTKIITNKVSDLTGYANTTQVWTSNEGKLASTTGNMYGVYDLAGGASEAVASFVSNSNSNVNVGELISKGDTEYAIIYNRLTTNETAYGNYDSNKDKYGDAIYETSIFTATSVDPIINSWFNNYSEFPISTKPFFIRGGSASDSNAGIFAYQRYDGAANENIGFRVVLCP